ncbi:MAG TPA: PH domain-containing protein [Jiangellaceae bacterium]|nr:PH domain-containing protein [Jiangellaceae bacterium]
MDQVFAPPGEAWQPVSKALVTLRRAMLVFWVAVLIVVSIVAGALFAWWITGIGAAIGLIALVWGIWLIPRNWRAWGYAERDDDLLVKHGVLVRKLSVVPYGRMQFVDVNSGPLERRVGIATVQLHTASPATDARIPGLPPDEAARLRDRLAALGEARAAGL